MSIEIEASEDLQLALQTLNVTLVDADDDEYRVVAATSVDRASGDGL